MFSWVRRWKHTKYDSQACGRGGSEIGGWSLDSFSGGPGFGINIVSSPVLFSYNRIPEYESFRVLHPPGL